jgi:hypothetical protein
MLGHTDRATINQRRPLTANMRGSLKTRSETKGPGVLWTREMTQAEKNAARALFVRDLVGWDNGLEGYYIKGQGLAALALPNGDRQ